MSKHFAFTVVPGHGHVNPTLPLVEELVARGHRVTYITGADLLPAVLAAGATPVARPWALPRPAQRGYPYAYSVEVLVAGLRAAQEQAELVCPSILAHFGQDRPDAVCFDSMDVLGPLLAGRLEVPTVALMPSWANNEHFDLRDMLVRGGMADDERLTGALAELAGTQARFRAANGLPTHTPALRFEPPCALHLVFMPRTFQIAGDTFDDRFRFLGPALGSRADAQGWQPPADGSPVLFISLGTAFNHRPDFYAQCIEAFGDSRWHVVMAVGERVELPPVPDNFEVAPYFPQPAVLAGTTVFLSHTGMNSTLESLYYGVPLVSVPQMPEQVVNGGRAAELGLGRRLDPSEITAELLRRTVDEVAFDPVIRANVTEFGAHLRAVDGAALGADALEELLG
ncbi:putative UDP-glucosyltransferase YjiC [Streptomyces sulfonofaciens]|uniref:UDP-glucosyltransferase YjiC n=1 Tax=Streptomyces sulfonofaciens TaxID=68272 RepID=A0A919GLN7_9ACTN|nr:macrolide family glycosyltransferase [Streptomyces sulfonofaciens]GHH87125.1 putative UDP-glucosyltransferase YjiC [Streptomyces sulfonofaciens]